MQHSHRANLFHVSPAVAQHHFPAAGRARAARLGLPRAVAPLWGQLSGRTGASPSCCPWHGCGDTAAPRCSHRCHLRPQSTNARHGHGAKHGPAALLGRHCWSCTESCPGGHRRPSARPKPTPPSPCRSVGHRRTPWKRPFRGTPLTAPPDPPVGDPTGPPSRTASHRLPSGDTDAPHSHSPRAPPLPPARAARAAPSRHTPRARQSHLSGTRCPQPRWRRLRHTRPAPLRLRRHLGWGHATLPFGRRGEACPCQTWWGGCRLRLGIATDGLFLLNVGCAGAFLPWHGLREAALPSRGSAAWERAVVFSRGHRASWEEVTLH